MSQVEKARGGGGGLFKNNENLTSPCGAGINLTSNAGQPKRFYSLFFFNSGQQQKAVASPNEFLQLIFSPL